jgi:hypothetical protein
LDVQVPEVLQLFDEHVDNLHSFEELLRTVVITTILLVLNGCIL